MQILKRYMLIFQFILLCSLLKSDNDKQVTTVNHEWKCTDMDTARLEFKLSDKITSDIEILYQYEICNQCDLVSLATINPINDTNKSVIIDSYYSYIFKVVSNLDKSTICSSLIYRGFGECGIYSMEIDDVDNRCSIKSIKNPLQSNLWLILGACLVILFILICNFIERNQEKIQKLFQILKNSSIVRSLEEVNLNEIENEQAEKVSEKKRLRSLDTFRGISLFLMIFVNYGSGGYKFMQHVPWHGITIADFVFPWFLWIMGFSIPLSTNSLLRKPNPKRLSIFKKILIRTIKMFIIGIMLNSRFGVQLVNLRIFGVLQRIAICYFIVSVLELVFYKEIKIDNSKKGFKSYIADLIWSKFHLTCVFLIILVWALLNFLVQVPGCPRGYMGPGGLEQKGLYYNCTGGIAGYLDKILFGRTHLYGRPTPQKIYKTTEPFDPEGLFGVFNSVVLTYLGVQAGRITIFYKDKNHQMISWSIWGVFCFVLFSILTQFDLDNGWIPVNKNLWTLTYTLITGSSSFLIFVVLFFLIDIKSFWSGNPFIYLGMNSILFYICHSIFSTTLPCQWIVSNTHLAKLLMNIWGAIFWTLVSIYFYKKKWFFNL